MAFTFSRFSSLPKIVQNAFYTTMLKRPMAYKSSIALDTLYPKSSLKIATPSFVADTKEKFSGYIPMNKLDITYSASSGPGGQNVNKVHTKVDLRFKLSEADWLHPDTRNKLKELAPKLLDQLERKLRGGSRVQQLHINKLSKEGYLIVKSDTTRSQQLNLADCLRKLRLMIRTAEHTNKEPSPETEERIRRRHLKASRLRVTLKREESLKRAMRQSPTVVDL